MTSRMQSRSLELGKTVCVYSEVIRKPRQYWSPAKFKVCAGALHAAGGEKLLRLMAGLVELASQTFGGTTETSSALLLGRKPRLISAKSTVLLVPSTTSVNRV